MPSIVPDLTLYVDPNYTPPWYWLDVLVDSGTGYGPDSHGTVPTTTSPSNEFHVDVNVQNPPSGGDTIEVDFGQLSADPENDEIHVHLIDASESEVGGGFIRLEDAQEGTRPTDPDDIT